MPQRLAETLFSTLSTTTGTTTLVTLLKSVLVLRSWLRATSSRMSLRLLRLDGQASSLPALALRPTVSALLPLVTPVSSMGSEALEASRAAPATFWVTLKGRTLLRLQLILLFLRSRLVPDLVPFESFLTYYGERD